MFSAMVEEERMANRRLRELAAALQHDLGGVGPKHRRNARPHTLIPRAPKRRLDMLFFSSLAAAGPVIKSARVYAVRR